MVQMKNDTENISAIPSHNINYDQYVPKSQSMNGVVDILLQFHPLYMLWYLQFLFEYIMKNNGIQL